MLWALLVPLILSAVRGGAGVEPMVETGDVASGEPRALFERLDAICERALARSRVPGLSVGVSIGGEPVYVRGFGLADLENQVPAHAETVYRIGSLTKQFTAALVLRACERHELGLYDSVSDVLPDYPRTPEPVLVAELLSHTAGIKNYAVLGGEFERCLGVDVTQNEIRSWFEREPLEFEPGNRFAYTNSGYFLLGQMLERRTGKSFARLIEEEIAVPLGLASTGYDSERAIVPHRAQGYRLVRGGLENDLPLGMSQAFAAGGLCSNVVDLLRWHVALTRGRVVGLDGYARMTKPTVLHDGNQVLYGLGLWLMPFEGRPCVRHNGTVNGFRSELAWYPADDVAIAVLANCEQAPVEAIEERLARAVLGIDAALGSGASRGFDAGTPAREGASGDR